MSPELTWQQCLDVLQYDQQLDSFAMTMDVAGMEKALQVTEACRQKVATGTARWETLLRATQSTQTGLNKEMSVAQAYSDMTPFDFGRPASDSLAMALADGQSAYDLIEASDIRVGALVAASTQWQASNGKLLADKLFERAQLLTQFDKERLDSDATLAYENGLAVARLAARWCGDVVDTSEKALSFAAVPLSGEAIEFAMTAFVERLLYEDYSVIENSAHSDVRLSFRGVILQTTESSVGTSVGTGVIVQLTIEANSNYLNQPVFSTTLKANGFATTAEEAKKMAMQRAGGAAFDEFWNVFQILRRAEVKTAKVKRVYLSCSCH